MPYTKTELESGTVEFYDEFINKLRRTYLNKLAGHATSSFRDKFDVLYSYEDINTGDGIEDVNIDIPTSLYHGLMTEEQQKKEFGRCWDLLTSVVFEDIEDESR